MISNNNETVTPIKLTALTTVIKEGKDRVNNTEKYSNQELLDMKERCLYMITSFSTGKDCSSAGWCDIYRITLVEINRELDERKNRTGSGMNHKVEE